MKFCQNHPEKKVFVKGLCRPCWFESLSGADKKIEREKQRLYSQKWLAKHPEKKKEYNKRQTTRTQRELGLTRQDVVDLEDKQESKCAICGGPSGERAFHADHDHRTGILRGLLCGKCNMALGHSHDNLLWLSRSATYLRMHQQSKADHGPILDSPMAPCAIDWTLLEKVNEACVAA